MRKGEIQRDRDREGAYTLGEHTEWNNNILAYKIIYDDSLHIGMSTKPICLLFLIANGSVTLCVCVVLDSVGERKRRQKNTFNVAHRILHFISLESGKQCMHINLHYLFSYFSTISTFDRKGDGERERERYEGKGTRCFELHSDCLQ